MNVDLIVIFLYISNTTVTQKLLNERGQANIKRQLCSTCFSFVAFNVQIFSVLWYSWLGRSEDTQSIELLLQQGVERWNVYVC